MCEDGASRVARCMRHRCGHQPVSTGTLRGPAARDHRPAGHDPLRVRRRDGGARSPRAPAECHVGRWRYADHRVLRRCSAGSFVPPRDLRDPPPRCRSSCPGIGDVGAVPPLGTSNASFALQCPTSRRCTASRSTTSASRCAPARSPRRRTSTQARGCGPGENCFSAFAGRAAVALHGQVVVVSVVGSRAGSGRPLQNFRRRVAVLGRGRNPWTDGTWPETTNRISEW